MDPVVCCNVYSAKTFTLTVSTEAVERRARGAKSPSHAIEGAKPPQK